MHTYTKHEEINFGATQQEAVTREKLLVTRLTNTSIYRDSFGGQCGTETRGPAAG